MIERPVSALNDTQRLSNAACSDEGEKQKKDLPTPSYALKVDIR